MNLYVTLHEGEKKMSKKRHCLWAALLAVILMCSPGCSKKDTGIDQGEANIPTQAPLAETVTAAPTQAPTDTPVPTATYPQSHSRA